MLAGGPAHQSSRVDPAGEKVPQAQMQAGGKHDYGPEAGFQSLVSEQNHTEADSSKATQQAEAIEHCFWNAGQALPGGELVPAHQRQRDEAHTKPPQKEPVAAAKGGEQREKTGVSDKGWSEVSEDGGLPPGAMRRTIGHVRAPAR